jgi:glycosyltransferase involved in cell wall biosynthesis
MENKNKKILFLSPYPINKAPSQRLKYEQYFTEFEKLGYQLKTSSFVSNKFWEIIYKDGFLIKKLIYTVLGYIKRFSNLFILKKYDIVYVHLWVTPFGLPFFEYLVVLIAKKVIYDIDDMVFLGHSSKANSMISALKGKNKMIYLMKKANHVITCTPTLDYFVKQYNKKTTDISSTVDTEKSYLPRKNYVINETVCIGWSGSHSTSKYLKLLEDVFCELSKKYNIKIIVIGDSTIKLKCVNYESVEWSEENEIKYLRKFDIGVYPLPDEKWVYGKSGLKAIQYMALGIPTVATAIGANYRIIQNEENGYLAENEKDWIDKLSKLIESEKNREILGRAGRKTVEEKYSVKVNKETYLKIFKSLS